MSSCKNSLNLQILGQFHITCWCETNRNIERSTQRIIKEKCSPYQIVLILSSWKIVTYSPPWFNVENSNSIIVCIIFCLSGYVFATCILNREPSLIWYPANSGIICKSWWFSTACYADKTCTCKKRDWNLRICNLGLNYIFRWLQEIIYITNFCQQLMIMPCHSGLKYTTCNFFQLLFVASHLP